MGYLPLEHIYTKFPEGKIRRDEVEIGGNTVEELIQELESKGFKIHDYAKFMMRSPDFQMQKHRENISTVRLAVRDLGFPNGATTDEIYKKAEQLGLELCPAEVGPRLRMQYPVQPNGEGIRIAMKQIPDPDGNPRVFLLPCDAGGLWLSYIWTGPGERWDGGREFVFRLRK